MHTPPPISEFTLNPEPPLPAFPLATRSRQKHLRADRLYHPQHYPNTRLQQVIIDVSTTNHRLLPSDLSKINQKQPGIRKHIDACLGAIESAHFQQKRKDLSSPHPAPDRTIHRIDASLVLQYIRTVCQDYRIKNRFGQLLDKNKQARHTMSDRKQTPSIVQSPTPSRERIHSLGPEARNRKQFLELTQTSKIERRGVTASKHKPQQQTSPRSHRKTHSINQSPPSNKINPFPIPQRQQSAGTEKIAEDFRYCINCQASILTKNVDYHEKYECKDFGSLYRLDFKELTALVGQKVGAIGKKLKEKVEWLQQRDESKSQRCEQISNYTLFRIQDYLNESTQNDTSFSLDRTNSQYDKFKESLDNQYLQVVKLTHKMHWFNQVFSKLKTQSQKRQAGGRNITLDNLPPSQPEAIDRKYIVPQSPISQLYPLQSQPFKTTANTGPLS